MLPIANERTNERTDGKRCIEDSTQHLFLSSYRTKLTISTYDEYRALPTFVQTTNTWIDNDHHFVFDEIHYKYWIFYQLLILNRQWPMVCVCMWSGCVYLWPMAALVSVLLLSFSLIHLSHPKCGALANFQNMVNIFDFTWHCFPTDEPIRLCVCIRWKSINYAIHLKVSSYNHRWTLSYTQVYANGGIYIIGQTTSEYEWCKHA